MRDGCPFCDYEGPSLILMRLESAFVIQPNNPVTPGHLLVIPYEHVADALDRPRVTAAVFEDVALYLRALFDMGRGIGAFNLITSSGRVASQTVFHLHVHIVPRREGDGLSLPWT